MRPDEVEEIHRLEGGYLNDVYRVDATSGPFALRVYSPLTTEAMACAEHELVLRVAGKLATVPAPIRSDHRSAACPTLVNGAALTLFVEVATLAAETKRTASKLPGRWVGCTAYWQRSKTSWLPRNVRRWSA